VKLRHAFRKKISPSFNIFIPEDLSKEAYMQWGGMTLSSISWREGLSPLVFLIVVSL
jgi:hypothetical protein